ncbi:MAG: hypothetical protein GF401_01410 [Chitinivibrionales bacterium]|nr:hypothetical protein [Chitinivibrionales bacterium]
MLKELIEKGGILHNPDFSKKEELFKWIAETAEKKGIIESADEFYLALIERENQMSTEIEPGISFPHAKHPSVKEMFLYVVISHKGIRFGGLGSKVKIIFLVGTPMDSQHYLDVMAAIARMLHSKEVKNALKASESSSEVISIIDGFTQAALSEKVAHRNRLGLFLILSDGESMESAMELAIALGVKGTSVMDGTNVAAKIALSFPFASLFSARNDRLSSKVLIGIIEHEEIAGRMYAHLKKEGIDLATPGTGTLFTMPLSTVYGGVDEEFF